MKKVIVVFLATVFSVSAFGQSVRTDFDLSGFGVKIGADKRLLVVRTTLELAGIQTELTKEGKEFREKVLADFKDIDPNLRDKLRIFVQQYAKRHPSATQDELASPFISMSYSLTQAPELAEPERSIDLPDNLLEVLDYSPLVREFYRSKGVAAKIDTYFEEHKGHSEFVKPSAREMVRHVLDYLHTRPRLSYVERVKIETTSGKKKLTKYEFVERFRSFTIVPDLLQSKGNINFLNIRDDYFAVIPAKTDVSASEVRRAYLQFVLDPLVLGHGREILLKKEAIRSLLSEHRRKNSSITPDPILAVSRSLVAATDIREEQFRRERIATDQARRKITLMKTDEEKRAVGIELNRVKQELADEALLRLGQSYENGAVFAFYFAEKLRGVEQSGFDISGSLLDWMMSLDPKNETKRLEDNREASQRALLARERRKTQQATTLVDNPLTRALLKIDVAVKAKNFGEAEKNLKGLLEEYKENKVETARIYYSLGRMTSLDAESTEDPEEVGVKLEKASRYYKSVLQTASPQDRALISSTYFALGRIYEHFDQNVYAMKIYEAALRIGNVKGGAFEEAFEAKKTLLAKKTKP